MKKCLNLILIILIILIIKVINVEAKNITDIRDNDAQIYVDDNEVSIKNKFSPSESRIYVKLDDLCESINCKYEKNDNKFNIKYYPIKDNENIIYSMILEENNNIFESVLKVHNEIYKFKNKVIDASPYYDNNVLYVPIRFIVEGLGAQVIYIPSKDNQPEKVKIYFDVDKFIETKYNNKISSDNTINIENDTTIVLKQYYYDVDETKKEMTNMKIINENNDYKICESNKINCQIIINNNNIIINDINLEINNLSLIVINKFNDYPYIKVLNLNKKIDNNTNVSNKKIPIIMYHGISDTPWGIESLFIKIADFEKQMKYLYDNGFETIFIEDIEKNYGNKKVVALTFDDGYVDFYHNVLPIIKKYNIKTNLYIVTDFEDPNNYLNNEQINQISESGLVSIGSHTSSHNQLATLNSIEIEKQLKNSKETLEKIIGKKVETISYPNGSYNEQVINIAQKYYKYGLTVKAGVQDMSNFKRYEILRTGLYRSNTFESFKEFVDQAK